MKTSQFMRRDFDAGRHGLASPDFRARLISEPRKTYEAQLGKPVPPETKIVVVEESGDTFYLVLPYLPDHLKSDPEKIGGTPRIDLPKSLLGDRRWPRIARHPEEVAVRATETAVPGGACESPIIMSLGKDIR